MMNTLVALPIVAALPVSSPAISAPSSSEDLADNVAVLARFERVIEDLRTRYISDDFKLDEAAVNRALLYFRRRAEGHPEDDAEWGDAIEFMVAYGQSFDWIFFENPTGMICSGAALALVKRREKQAQASDDALIEMENEIFDLKEKIENFDPELVRLH